MRLAFYILILVVTYGCKQKEDPIPVANPYNLEYPIYFGDNVNTPGYNPTTIEGVKLGRHLFYEKMLSSDSTVSCGTCHQQSLSFTDGLDFSVGVGGMTDRSSMSITNALWNHSFFWDGRAATLEEQALGPIQNPVEMNLTLTEAVNRLQASAFYEELFYEAFGSKTITAERIGMAISQFERTLISKNSKFDQYKNGQYVMDTSEYRGLELFFTHPEPTIGLRGGNCADCHGSALTFQGGFHNNGLDTVFSDLGRENVTGLSSDRGKFKAPSLRNIALTAPYMHDGRFSTLEEVLDHYNEHVKRSTTLDALIQNITNKASAGPEVDSLYLTEIEKEQIIVFLHLLTDSTFICNPEFSDPNQ